MATDARSAKVRLKAEAGEPEAMLELANGWLLNTDPEGRVWLDRAAQAASAGACAALGWSHEKGLHGGAVDLARALDCYERAIAGGVTVLGPLKLAAHVRKLAGKVKRQAKPGHDPLAELFRGAKLTGHRETILAARLPSIRWVAKPLQKGDLALGSSKLGGSPDLPTGTAWPKGAGRSLVHVATLDFDTVAPTEGLPKMAGKLVFFHDADHPSSAGGEGDGPWAIIAVERGAELVRTRAPKGTRTLKPSLLFAVVEVTLPSVCAHSYRDLGLPNEALDRYRDLREAWPPADRSIEVHRSFGHGDVTEESEAPEPLLLLQVDSYAHGNVHWGDAGRIFWWIQPADLAARRFHEAHFQLQD